MPENASKKADLLKIYKGVTGKVTHEGYNQEPSAFALTGYYPARESARVKVMNDGT